MKTSTKFLTAALALLLGALAAFNLSLRAEYARGTYKDPLRNTTTLKFSGFTEVSVLSASALKVRIVAGPYSVRLSDQAAEFVQVSQQGRRLRVTLAFPEGRQYLGGGDVLTITCPQLRQLSASARYLVEGKLLTDRENRGGSVRVQGFRQDSLTLRQDHATRIELAGNQLGYLRAGAGASPGSHPVLLIGSDNRIQAADLMMQACSVLEQETRIERPHYVFGDSTKVSFSGSALGGLSPR
ncbi:hypothetical protein [uncultured Hymenobacter sp.]|uniref:hypothetical protein n=1 Tax=uncultured Hymenobacter sp. TaxID=170016 RepID=UPI0035CBBDBE